MTAEYFAGGGLTAYDPDFWWGWTPHNASSGASLPGIPVVNDLNTGRNAWGIDDNATSNVNPFYSQCVDGVMPNGACGVGLISSTAKQSGWRYSTNARFVADYGTEASLGMSLWLENRGYFVLFDLSGTNLRATLFNSGTSNSVTLTAGGVDATTYHEIALVYLPATKRVAFEFDGAIKAYTTGVAQTHDNAMLWGNLSTTGRGRMNFHDVAFQLLLPGDYNRDNVVDAADYTVWRSSVGSNLAAADGDENGKIDTADYVFWKNRFGDSGRWCSISPREHRSRRVGCWGPRVRAGCSARADAVREVEG